jgi:hypothetical protein
VDPNRPAREKALCRRILKVGVSCVQQQFALQLLVLTKVQIAEPA